MLGLSVQKPVVQATRRDETVMAAWWDRAGRSSKKRYRAGTNGRLGRRVRVLPPAREGAPLCAAWTNANTARARDTQLCVGDRGVDGRRALAGPDATLGVSQPGSRAVSEASVPASSWQAVGDLRWRANSSQPRHQAVFGERSGRAAPTGATARLRTPAESGRIGLRYPKHVALRNVCCATLDDLQYELRLVLASVRHRREVLQRFPRRCGYHV